MTSQQRRELWIIAGVAIVAFLALLIAATDPAVTALDDGTKTVVRSGRHPLLGPSMQTLTRLGSGYVQLPLAAVVCAAVWRRHRRLARSVVVVSAATVVAVAVLKWLIGRPRPNLTTYGFPSGHVLGTLVLSGVLLYLLWVFAVGRGWRAGAAVGFALLTIGVAYSRLYVNAHWLTDVMGGVTGGFAATALAVLFMDGQLTDEPAVPPG